MSVIDDLVAQARRLVKGIDWDDLDSRSVGVPLDPQQPAHIVYWTEYLGPAFNRAADVINTLYYDPIIVNRVATQESIDGVWSKLKISAPDVLDQFNYTAVTSSLKIALESMFGNPIPLPADSYRLLISYVWGVIQFGTKLHTTFAIASQGRAVMRDHANHIVMLCEAISLIDQVNGFKQLKWNSEEMVELRKQQGVSALKPFSTPPMATSGLGATALGLAPVVAVALGVLGAIVLMYGIYRWTTYATEVNRQTLEATKDVCSDPSYTAEASTREQCVQILGDALARTTTIKPPGSDLIKYLMWGGVAAVAIVFAPQIVHSIKGAMSEAKKPA